MHDWDEEQRWSRRVPKLVKLSCVYCIYVLNLKHNKSIPCHIKSEELYHISHVSHRSFGRAAICSLSHYWAVLKNRYFRPWVTVLYCSYYTQSVTHCRMDSFCLYLEHRIVFAYLEHKVHAIAVPVGCLENGCLSCMLWQSWSVDVARGICWSIGGRISDTGLKRGWSLCSYWSMSFLLNIFLAMYIGNFPTVTQCCGGLITVTER